MKTNETIGFLFPSAFPLRVKYSNDGFWAVWTRQDDDPGSLNNFAVCEGINSDDEANHICRVLNQAHELEF